MWRWARARAVGTSHAATGAPCQDATGALQIDGPEGPVLVAVASDGAGSAAFSREGARAVVRGILSAAATHFAGRAEMPCQAEVHVWLDGIRDHIGFLAERRGTSPRQFAATLVTAFASPTSTCFAHVGDGGAVVNAIGEGWEVGSWPAGGEFAGTTYFVTDPEPKLALCSLARPVSTLAVFTDGIEHLVLQEAERRPHAPFFDMMFGAMSEGDGVGCDRALSRSLRTYLRSDSMNSRTHDDKSLVLALRR